MQKTKYYIISHTHWDREWYEEFQEYRARLVRFMDDLLNVLESDPEYRCFHLDGQTIVLDDYLKIRPQNRDRLLRLIRERRILIGPWYVMPDSFLVSGESLVRNLEKGIGICRGLGVEPMLCGYVPDLFGHNSQFPQILNGFGIDTAVLFRGIADFPKDTFLWEGADGSRVTTFKMDRERAYSNFFFAVRWPYAGRAMDRDDQAKRMRALMERMEETATSSVRLLMDGVDHIDAEPEVPALLSAFARAFPDAEFYHASLEEYIAAVRQAAPQLDIVQGSLNHIGKRGMINLLLKIVLSSLVHLKQTNDRLETCLTRRVEPLHTFLGLAERVYGIRPSQNDIGNKGDFIKEAWELLMQNHPHDSICGCSITEVHEDTEYRFRQTDAICRTLLKNMGEYLCASVATAEGAGKDGAVLIVNSGQDAVNELVPVELCVPADNQNHFEFFNAEGEQVPVQILGMHHSLSHSYPLRELITFKPWAVLHAVVPLSVPANGYTTLTYNNRKTPALPDGAYCNEKFCPPSRLSGSLRKAPRVFDTGPLEVTFQSDGTMDVLVQSGGVCFRKLLAFEDTGDIGDGYNYTRPRFDSQSISSYADFSIEADGPFAAVVKIITHMRLPERIDPSDSLRRSPQTLEQDITSYVTLLKGSAQLQIRTVIENRCLNHRMRALFPTGLATDVYYTKTPFAMTKWDVLFSGWEDANEMETFVRPSQGVVYMADSRASFALFSKGLYEVSVSQDLSRTVELTLFRSTTSEVAGHTGTMGHMRRTMEFELCLSFSECVTPGQACVRGENWRAGLYSLPSALHDGALPMQLSFLRVETEKGAAALSSCTNQVVYGRDGTEMQACVVRLYDVSGEGSSGRIILSGPLHDAFYVNLDGRYIADAHLAGGAVAFEAGSCAVVSLAAVPVEKR